MAGSREGAIARAPGFDDGRYPSALRRRVAVPTESRMPERLPGLRRTRAEALPPMIADMGFGSRVLDNPESGGGPVLVAGIWRGLGAGEAPAAKTGR